MIAFIDDQRAVHGVELICKVLPPLGSMIPRIIDFPSCPRQPTMHTRRNAVIHRADRGSQYVSIKYTERLAEAGIEPSVGSVGDSYDNPVLSLSKGLWPRPSMAFTRPR